ncbi:MAG: hypothetical protein ABSB96_06850 [Gaiellaceae bacterium]
MHKTVALTRAFIRELPLIRKFVVAIGLGLVVASLKFDIVHSGFGFQYGRDGTTRGFVYTLVVLGTALLVTNVLLETDRFIAAASGIGAVLLGFFSFVPLSLGLGHLGDIDIGSWFALGGGAAIVIGAAPLGALASWKKESARPGWAVYVSWLVGILGLALVMVSLPRPLSTEKLVISGKHQSTTFWNSAGVSTGGHTLGAAMIVIAAIAAACVIAAALTRVRLFESWTVALSLVVLGIVLYLPVRLAFNDLGGLRSGSGLAIEGALVAVAALVTAALAQRGVIELNKGAVRQLVAVVGLGLALAGNWTEVFSTTPGNLWADGTLGGFPFILIVAGAVLVVASFLVKRWWILPVASALGWVLLGFFAFEPALAVPKSGNLGPATWLGMAGGAVLGLSALSPRLLTYWRRRPLTLTRNRAAAWLAAGAGLALVVVSLWLATERSVKNLHFSYWNVVGIGDHSLGIVMLVLAVLALVALAGAVVTRIPLLAELTLAASLVLVGIAIYQPAFFAFDHLGEFRAGTWLALAASLLASAGAAALILVEEPVAGLQRAATDASAAAPMGAPVRRRRAARGRVPGMRAKK